MLPKRERDRIGAIVLAAGSSRRMGRNKSLLPIDGTSMIARVVETVRDAGVQPNGGFDCRESASLREGVADCRKLGQSVLRRIGF